MKYCRSLDQVTPREVEVLQFIANEYTIKEMAQALYISTHTAISHRKNLMEKWDVKNMAGLVRVGFETGILSLNKLDY